MSEQGATLLTSGTWRQVKDEKGWPSDRLPSRKGTLTVVRIPGGPWPGEWIVLFRTKSSMSQRWATSAEIDPETGYVSLDGGVTVYAPSSAVARAPRLPLPPRPTLTRFERLDHENGGFTIHQVSAVREWPDPNREWNREDALVTAKCGYGGWVQPEHMQPDLPLTYGTIKRECTECLGL